MSMIERLETYANIKTNEPMSKHTTYHVGGNVDYYIYPDNFLSLMRNQYIGRSQYSILYNWSWIQYLI